MKTVGKILREARLKKGYTLEYLERETKIKKQFISAIEYGQWEKLPVFPVVTGFVKNLSFSLDLDKNQIVSILRRDYPPKRISEVNPKPEIKKKFRWNPKFTFILFTVLLILVSLGYLFFQYAKFTSPPILVVASPQDGEIVKERTLKVSGKTDPESTIIVNNQSVIVNDNGTFQGEIEISEVTKDVEIIARSRSGKETIIHRKINLELK